MDKFRGYKKFQRFINQAPKQVLQAYRAGWSEIEHNPKGCFGMDSDSFGWDGVSSDGKWGIIYHEDDKDNKNPVSEDSSCCCCCSH